VTCYNTLVNGLERNMFEQGADMIVKVTIEYKPRRKKRKKGLVKTCKHMYNVFNVIHPGVLMNIT
jgi:hypothetical protein